MISTEQNNVENLLNMFVKFYLLNIFEHYLF